MKNLETTIRESIGDFLFQKWSVNIDVKRSILSYNMATCPFINKGTTESWEFRKNGTFRIIEDTETRRYQETVGGKLLYIHEIWRKKDYPATWKILTRATWNSQEWFKVNGSPKEEEDSTIVSSIFGWDGVGKSFVIPKNSPHLKQEGGVWYVHSDFFIYGKHSLLTHDSRHSINKMWFY